MFLEKFEHFLREEQFLNELQAKHGTFRGKNITWTHRGCLILAQGISPILHLPVVAVFDSWDEEPYHAGILYNQAFVDGEGVTPYDTFLKEWEEFLRGGAFCRELTGADIQEFGFLLDAELSQKISQYFIGR